MTKNKTYDAPWQARVNDMMTTLKKNFDDGKFMISLTKHFAKQANTPKPESVGINMLDVYLDDNFDINTRSPDNNCYVNMNHPHFLANEHFINKKYSFD